MPVIDLGNKEAEKIITDYLKELRPAAFEIIYSDPKIASSKINNYF